MAPISDTDYYFPTLKNSNKVTALCSMQIECESKKAITGSDAKGRNFGKHNSNMCMYGTYLSIFSHAYLPTSPPQLAVSFLLFPVSA